MDEMKVFMSSLRRRFARRTRLWRMSCRWSTWRRKLILSFPKLPVREEMIMMKMERCISVMQEMLEC